VVQWILHLYLDDVPQILEVHAIARFLSRRTLYGDVELVIVAVPIGIGAFAEDFEVSLLGPIVVPQFVGGIESGAAGDVNVFHGLLRESTFAP
jgi:hypothetical protein